MKFDCSGKTAFSGTSFRNGFKPVLFETGNFLRSYLGNKLLAYFIGATFGEFFIIFVAGRRHRRDFFSFWSILTEARNPISLYQQDAKTL